MKMYYTCQAYMYHSNWLLSNHQIAPITADSRDHMPAAILTTSVYAFPNAILTTSYAVYTTVTLFDGEHWGSQKQCNVPGSYLGGHSSYWA